MSPETRQAVREVIALPVKVLAGLLVLMGLSLAYAYLPGVPLKFAAGLAIAVVKLALVALFFMELKSAGPLIRLAAAAGLCWLSFLFLLSFTDRLTR